MNLLQRIALYYEHRNHDIIRKEKLMFWEAFRIRDNDFDYKKQLKGNLWFYIKNKDIKA